MQLRAPQLKDKAETSHCTDFFISWNCQIHMILLAPFMHLDVLHVFTSTCITHISLIPSVCANSTQKVLVSQFTSPLLCPGYGYQFEPYNGATRLLFVACSIRAPRSDKAEPLEHLTLDKTWSGPALWWCQAHYTDKGRELDSISSRSPGCCYM